MEKYIRKNGDIEYFTTDIYEFLEIAIHAEKWRTGGTMIDDLDYTRHSPIGFVELEDLSEAKFAFACFTEGKTEVTYYYGVRKFHHCGGWLVGEGKVPEIGLNSCWNDWSGYDTEGIEYYPEFEFEDD